MSDGDLNAVDLFADELLNMSGFLICHGSRRVSICKIGAFRTVSNVQNGKFVKILNK